MLSSCIGNENNQDSSDENGSKTGVNTNADTASKKKETTALNESKIIKIISNFINDTIKTVNIDLIEMFNSNDSIHKDSLPHELLIKLKLEKQTNGDSIVIKFITEIPKNDQNNYNEFEYIYMPPYLIRLFSDTIIAQNDTTSLKKVTLNVLSEKEPKVLVLKNINEAKNHYSNRSFQDALNSFKEVIDNCHKMEDVEFINSTKFNAYLGIGRIYYKLLSMSTDEIERKQKMDSSLIALNKAIEIDSLSPEVYAFKAKIINTKIDWKYFDRLMQLLRRENISITEQIILEQIIGYIDEMEMQIMQMDKLLHSEEKEFNNKDKNEMSYIKFKTKKDYLNGLLIIERDKLLLHKTNREYAKKILMI